MPKSILIPHKILIQRPGHLPFYATRYRKVFSDADVGIKIISIHKYKGNLQQVYQAWNNFVGSYSGPDQYRLLIPVLALQEILYKDNFTGILAIGNNRIVGVASFEILDNELIPSIVSASPFEVSQGSVGSINTILQNGMYEYAKDHSLRISDELSKARVGLVPKEVPIHREGKVFEGVRWVRPEEGQRATLGKIRIPPAWTDVWINPKSNAALQAVGKDSKGRQQYLYSKQHSQKAAAAKFKRLRAFNAYLPKIRTQIKKDLFTKEEAVLLYLIDKTGFRIGSNKETLAAKKAYGASTLEGRHIKIVNSKVSFDFIGKKGVRIQKEIDDQLLAEVLSKYKKQDDQALFSVTDGDAREYLHSVTKKPFTIKDFRTHLGTTVGLQEVEKHTLLPTTQKELKKLRRSVAEAVALALGNTPAVALSAYIAPEIFSRWTAAFEGKK